MIRRGWGVGAAVVAAAVLVTGCSGGPEQVATPSPTPTETVGTSASPTPTPSATALTEEEILAAIPEAARTEDFPGAEAFARFFIVESQEMLRRKDSALFEGLSHPECIFCQASFDTVDRHIAEDLTLEGGEIAIVSEMAQGFCDTAATCHVELDIEVAASRWVDGAGDAVEEIPAESLRVAVETAFVGDHWVTTGVGSEARS